MPVAGIAPLTKEGRPINEGRAHRNSTFKPLGQLIALQQKLYELATAEGVKPQVVAQLVNSFTSAEDKRQVLVGYGKPRPVQARNEPGQRKSKAKGSGMIDPSKPKTKPLVVSGPVEVSSTVSPLSDGDVTQPGTRPESPVFNG